MNSRRLTLIGLALSLAACAAPTSPPPTATPTPVAASPVAPRLRLVEFFTVS